jgi:uncharacterized protein involved in cysteine biosynthesis
VIRPIARSAASFVFGLTLPFHAATLVLRSPALLAASLGPWLVSLALDVWVIHRMQEGLQGWIQGHLSGTLGWVAVALSWVALLIVGALAFTFIAGIVALPLNDYLAELTERRATPALASTGSISWTGRARLLSIDLFKTVCALCLSGLALILSWVPVLNLAGAMLAFLLVAFQFLSYPQTRRGQGLLAGALYLGHNFWACLGFGISFAFLFAIPLVSSLGLPLAVVAGTLLYARGAPLEEQLLPAKPAH